MKKIGSFNLGLAFAGCFLGAGYVSGQELWQFFGSFGAKGVAGLLLAVALLFFTGIIMILLGRLTRLSEIDKIVVRRDWPLLRGAVTVLELLFLFGVGTIMSAGVGALLEQLFGLAPFIGSAVFAALVAVVSLAGFSGMVSAFSATVPVLSVVTLIFGIMSICSNGLVLPQSGGGSNPLMSSWLVAAVSFACYNVFGSIAMIAPLGPYVKSKKAAVGGIAIGACVLLLIAGSVLVSVSAAPETADAQLPMLALAQSRGIVWGYVYGVLLLLAMFGTALSSLHGKLQCVRTLLVAEIRQMVLFLVHRYFLLQLVIPNVIVRLRRVFPTACIRPTVPIGDELLDSISASAVECFRPPPVIFITPILKYRELGDTVLDDVPSHRPHLLEKLRGGGNHGD